MGALFAQEFLKILKIALGEAVTAQGDGTFFGNIVLLAPGIHTGQHALLEAENVAVFGGDDLLDAVEVIFAGVGAMEGIYDVLAELGGGFHRIHMVHPLEVFDNTAGSASGNGGDAQEQQEENGPAQQQGKIQLKLNNCLSQNAQNAQADQDRGDQGKNGENFAVAADAFAHDFLINGAIVFKKKIHIVVCSLETVGRSFPRPTGLCICYFRSNELG